MAFTHMKICLLNTKRNAKKNYIEYKMVQRWQKETDDT